MAFEMRDLSGSLFKNDKKTADNHPDYTGSALIDGTEYWVSSWIKKGKVTFMSMSFKPKDKQESRKPEKQPEREPGDDSDFPF